MIVGSGVDVAKITGTLVASSTKSGNDVGLVPSVSSVMGYGVNVAVGVNKISHHARGGAWVGGAGGATVAVISAMCVPVALHESGVTGMAVCRGCGDGVKNQQ